MENIIDFLKGYFQTDKCFFAYVIVFGIFIIFMIHAKFLRDKFGDRIAEKDFMNKNIGGIPLLKNISWWPVSHFVMYFILGFMFPYCARGLLTLGMLWEIFESLLGYFNINKNLVKPSSLVYQYSSWWAGTVHDLFYNLFGFICGAFFSLYIFK